MTRAWIGILSNPEGRPDNFCHGLLELQLVADCGSDSFEESALLTANLNVFISGGFREEAETTVTVNTQFIDIFKDLLSGGMWQKPFNSKGTLEQNILKHVEAYLISR